MKESTYINRFNKNFTIRDGCWEWGEGVNFVAIKRNNHKPLAVVPLDDYLNLLKKELYK